MGRVRTKTVKKVRVVRSFLRRARRAASARSVREAARVNLRTRVFSRGARASRAEGCSLPRWTPSRVARAASTRARAASLAGSRLASRPAASRRPRTAPRRGRAMRGVFPVARTTRAPSSPAADAETASSRAFRRRGTSGTTPWTAPRRSARVAASSRASTRARRRVVASLRGRGFRSRAVARIETHRGTNELIS